VAAPFPADLGTVCGTRLRVRLIAREPLSGLGTACCRSSGEHGWDAALGQGRGEISGARRRTGRACGARGGVEGWGGCVL